MDIRKFLTSNTNMNVPFNGRLLLERLKSRSRLNLAAGLAGAVLTGGFYYIVAIAFGPEETYQAVSSYYVDYDSLPEAIGDSYYNDAAAWEELLRSDAFTEVLASDLPDHISNHDLKASLSVIMNKDNDIRYYKLPSIAVTAHDPMICMQISDSVNKHFAEIALSLDHVATVRRADTAIDAVDISPSPRLLQAVILGCFLGLFGSITICFIYEMKSSHVWLPSMVTAKYGLIAAGSLEDCFLSVNLNYLFQCCQTMALVTPETVGPPEKIYKTLTDKYGDFMNGKRWQLLLTPGKVKERMSTLNSVDGMLLIIPSGHINDGEISIIANQFNQQVNSRLKVACILWNADESLLRRYYGT